MSGGFAATPIVWLDDERLTAADVCVITALMSWIGCDEIRPSHARIAMRAHVCEKTVRTALDHLRELGLVEWSNRRRENGGKTSNAYQVNLPTAGASGTPSVAVTDTSGNEYRSPSVAVTDEVDKREVDKKKREPLRELPLPKDWQPTPEHRQMAADKNLTLAVEVAKFKAYAEEHGRRAKSWNGAFTRWLINAQEYAARDNRGTNGNAPVRRQYRPEPAIDPATFSPLGVRYE